MSSYKELSRGPSTIADAENAGFRTQHNHCSICDCCRPRSLCVWVTVACLYLFVLIPGGLVLIMRGQNRHGAQYQEVLGIVILVVAVCVGPFVWVIIRWRRLRRADLRAERLATAARNLRPYSSSKSKDNEEQRLAEDIPHEIV